MKKFKKKIVILIAIVFGIALICITLLYFLNRNITKQQPNIQEGDTITEYYSKKLRDPSKFFSIQKCIKENIDESFVAEEMNIREGDTIFNYAVKGYIVKNGKNIEEIFIVRVDVENLTFVIEEKADDIEDINKINLDTNMKKIDNDGTNTFEYVQISNEEISRIYYEQFSKIEREDVEKAYSLLDKDYKEERFQTISNFKDYIGEYTKIIEDGVLAKYSVDYKEDYTEYVLVDSYNNSYLLTETSVMNYTIKLDNYTIKVDDYSNNYIKLSNKNKVQSNVYIFLQMVNTKDYEHAYELMDETFKNNNFETLNSFKEYINNNFFSYNLNTEDIKIEAEGNYYVYNTTIKNSSSRAAESKNLTVIMKLQEGTDFVMSFSIEDNNEGGNQ